MFVHHDMTSTIHFMAVLIKLYQPFNFQGGREVDDFLKYLAKESTDGLKGYDRKGKKKKSEL